MVTYVTRKDAKLRIDGFKEKQLGMQSIDLICRRPLTDGDRKQGVLMIRQVPISPLLSLSDCRSDYKSLD